MLRLPTVPKGTCIQLSLARLEERASRGPYRFLIFFLLLLLRRHMRLFHPQVWVEDAATTYGGTDILDFVRYGIGAFLRPVNGYLVTLPKLISGTSLLISFSYYPLISTILAWLATLLILTFITSRKTQMRGGVWLGVLTLMVPSDPEVLGLPMYTLWWATLLLFAVILWEANSSDLKWRLPAVLIGGLSSPVVVATTPLFFLRALQYRRRWEEWTIFSAGALCAAWQLWVYTTCGITFPPTVPVTTRRLAQIVPQFFGRYLVGNMIPGNLTLWLAGFGLLALAVFALALRWRCFRYSGIACLFAVVVAVTMYRVDVSILNPVHAGPRYFFLPFVVISWFVLQAAADDNFRYLRAASVLVVLFSLVNAIPVLTRNHVDFHWRENVLSCPFFDHYSIPVQFDGRADHPWELRITGAQCSILLEHDLLRGLHSQPLTFPYATLPFGPGVSTAQLASLQSINENAWTAIKAAQSDLNGPVPFQAFQALPTGESRITLRLHRGETVLYRSDGATSNRKLLIHAGRSAFLQRLPPAAAWTMLFFSNSLLPDEFSATFVNEGAAGSRSWAMVALKKQ